uniref:Importin N-terminal domain-containing protein n=1 Tax=Chromera velia CCMP2878 TaxID=1169474 RepID=A0A0G4G748_9ALVE|mmetsp:Transcript_3156/g.6543  ORF Transcript_3156/g.6543 Transcript_3156/m.6543 type:complete len:1135 (+) Transcript_3156:277-3681(+)|eukprot:Cvel_20525.t1-p1 / transcript=Cvel_20525.t1 / gene=Cvel_20525 / organism=Chromera_velia_CCMP2878 / gene_product=Transportin-3, putative / transcript_product=Transportin-3, putative / location=Cvel_scaffold1850:2743-15491(-) / protein_length=1134 / sequence_SO=supercontig / SO=protein_coding / is_pseudo=false
MDTNEVVAALGILYQGGGGAVDPAKLQEADAFLTQWQQTTGAWQFSDSLLCTETGVPAEVHYFAAQTLRTKVQFDFAELPEGAAEGLCQSLLNNLTRFRNGPDTVRTQLCLALADLSMHTSSTWRQPLTTIVTKIRQQEVPTPTGVPPQSFDVLLDVILVIAEEHFNYKVLCDHQARRQHKTNLQNEAESAMAILVESRPHLTTERQKEKLLSSWAAWLPFLSVSARAFVEQPLLHDCYTALSEGGSVGETAADCLVKVIDSVLEQEASAREIEEHVQRERERDMYENENGGVNGGQNGGSSPSALDPNFSSHAFADVRRGLATTAVDVLGGKVQQAIQDGDDEAVAALAKVVVSLARSCVTEIVQAVGSPPPPIVPGNEAQAQALLLQQQRFASLADRVFQVTAVVRNGEPSFAAPTAALDFWLEAAHNFCSQRRRYKEAEERGQTNSAEKEAVVAWARTWETLWARILEAVITMMTVPTADPRVEADTLESEEFWDYRQLARVFLDEVADALSEDAAIQKTMALISQTGAAQVPHRQRDASLEAQIFALAKFAYRTVYSRGRAGVLEPVWTLVTQLPPIVAPPEQATNGNASAVNGVASSSSSNASSSSSPFGTPSPSSSSSSLDAVGVLFRKSAMELLRDLGPGLDGKKEFVPLVLDMVAKLILTDDNQPLQPPRADDAGEGRDSSDDRNFTAYALKARAAQTLRKIAYDAGPALHSFHNQLIELSQVAQTKLQTRDAQDVTEAAALVIGSLHDNGTFFAAMERLCKPPLESLSQTVQLQGGQGAEKTKAVEALLSSRLDWISSTLSSVKGSNRLRDAAHEERMNGLGAFTASALFPVLLDVLRGFPHSDKVMDKVARALKHGMRTCPQAFTPLLPTLLPANLELFKTFGHPSCMYVSEYLVTAYANDPTIREALAQHFNELSGVALPALDQKMTQEGLQQCGTMIEDCFGMWQRYSRNCPDLVASSPQLRHVLALSLRAFRVEPVEFAAPVFAFLEYLYDHSRAEDLQNPLSEALRPALRALMEQFTPEVLKEFFKHLGDAPPADVVDRLSIVLETVVGCFQQQCAPWIAEALLQLPTGVMGSADARADTASRILRGGRSRIVVIREIAYRCQQLSMRKRNRRTGQSQAA